MQKRSQETRSNILQAALDLFANTGYDAASVAEICQAAGVSKGAFYHHFPSKHAVFMEILQNWLALLEQQLIATLQEAQDVPHALLRMADLMQHIFEQASGKMPMFLEFWAQASRDPEVWQVVIAPYQHYQHFFEALVQRGMAEGTLEAHNPQVAAQSVTALALGLLLQGILAPTQSDWSTLPKQSIQILLQGLAKK